MSSKSDYILLNFDELNEKGLTRLTKEIGKAGYEIAKVVPAGKSRKKDGIMTRTFTLIGMDEQVMDIQVNDTGDISGIKVNGKTAPYKPVKTIPALAQSIAALFNRGATAFQKALARKMARAAKVNLDDGKKKSTGVKSNAQQLADAKAARDAITEDIQQVKTRLGVVQKNADGAMKEAESVKAALNHETARTRQLKEEIARLEETA
ncbi:hypothetical protein ACSI5N_25280 (plasmid) [Raoultella ornithinolytica]|uniref:defense against restriction DarA-related protein n=1 Tax=Raoultella ornithinolytica TaxID=54291 RepID=UPI00292C9B11|nr:hypothetical protein [Raoultella ornithinolytica]MDV1094939.1 hypothetical protein [Raoultella ornithinolytica]MDV1122717.1 hypothetical protein [Raoultella ornithinolytica]MDV1893232.1 hypothetical protein [Raoultella ornithinolytica]